MTAATLLFLFCLIGFALHFAASWKYGDECPKCGALTDRTPHGDACPYCDKELYESWNKP